MIKIILVDDHIIFREGIKTMLSAEGVAEIIAEAGDGKNFLELLPNHIPDLVLMDISMPLMDGMEATRLALKKYPDLKILALSSFGDEKYYSVMVEAGAKGFLLKSTNLVELEQAITVVASGGNWFSPELLLKVIGTLKNIRKHFDEFSDRETDILKHICTGLTNEQISKEMYLSYDTIRWYRRNLLAKTSCPNTAALVMYCLKNKIISF